MIKVIITSGCCSLRYSQIIRGRFGGLYSLNFGRALTQLTPVLTPIVVIGSSTFGRQGETGSRLVVVVHFRFGFLALLLPAGPIFVMRIVLHMFHS